MGSVSQHRARAKEIFMADAQQNSRPCAHLHSIYVIEPVSHLQVLPADTVIATVTEKLGISRGMDIHQCTDQRMVMSFPQHNEALQAMRLEETGETFNVSGCLYRLLMDEPFSYSPTVTACRRVYLTLKCLPLQMWTGPIVEQILSPYCALEYIEQEARTMEDLSAFTCIARCQRAIPIPDEISVKVPQDTSFGGPVLENSAASLFLNRYTVFLEKNQYIHGVTKRSMYKNAPVSGAADHIVTPPECFISSRMFDQRIIQKYSAAVVLHPKPGTYFADLRHVCSFVRENMHVRVRIKMLTDGAFLLYFAEDHPFMSLHKMLSMSFQEWISNAELELLQWTPEYGSVGDTVTQVAGLRIRGLPCNLNSAPIIEYILSPFAFVKTHLTVTGDNVSDVGNTVTSYRCSVWCVGPHVIPAMLKVKMLPLYLTDLTQVTPDGKCKCSLLKISIRASDIVDEALLI